jgi:cephalosporin hydroxylase
MPSATASIADLVRAAYEERLGTESDIRGHLQFMHDTAENAGGRVIELGVRSGNSTSAFLAAAQSCKHGRVASVDTDMTTSPAEWHGHPAWSFIMGDDMSDGVLAMVQAWVPVADVLFIDTSHAYMHTIRELRRWVPFVRPGGWVLMHDTQYDPTGHETGGVPQPRWPVSVALTEYCAERGLRWANRPGYFGMGVLQIPEAHGTSA